MAAESESAPMEPMSPLSSFPLENHGSSAPGRPVPPTPVLPSTYAAKAAAGKKFNAEKVVSPKSQSLFLVSVLYPAAQPPKGGWAEVVARAAEKAFPNGVWSMTPRRSDAMLALHSEEHAAAMPAVIP